MHRAEHIPFLKLSLDSASESSHHCILEYLYFYISNIIWIRIILVHLMDDPIPLIREAMTQGTHVSLCDAGAKVTHLHTAQVHSYILNRCTWKQLPLYGRNLFPTTRDSIASISIIQSIIQSVICFFSYDARSPACICKTTAQKHKRPYHHFHQLKWSKRKKISKSYSWCFFFLLNRFSRHNLFDPFPSPPPSKPKSVKFTFSPGKQKKKKS